MLMKKFVMIVSLFFLFVCPLAACSKTNEKDTSATVSYIQVIDKGKTDDGEYWILVTAPDQDKNKTNEFKINLAEKNTWNLIEIDGKYVSHYAKRNNGFYYLYEIEPMK